jgi:hypothetical protein
MISRRRCRNRYHRRQGDCASDPSPLNKATPGSGGARGRHFSVRLDQSNFDEFPDRLLYRAFRNPVLQSSRMEDLDILDRLDAIAFFPDCSGLRIDLVNLMRELVVDEQIVSDFRQNEVILSRLWSEAIVMGD